MYRDDGSKKMRTRPPSALKLKRIALAPVWPVRCAHATLRLE